MAEDNNQLQQVTEEENFLSVSDSSDIIEAYKTLSKKAATLTNAKSIDSENLKQRLRLSHSWEHIKSDYISTDILSEYKNTLEKMKAVEHKIASAEEKMVLIFDRYFDIVEPTDEQRENFEKDKRALEMYVSRLSHEKEKNQNYFLKLVGNIGFKESLTGTNKVKSVEEENLLESILKQTNLTVVQNNVYKKDGKEVNKAVTVDAKDKQEDNDTVSSIQDMWNNLS